jgi:DNA topoisomerase-1
MSKKYSTSTTLVIVESPAKCKKIEEYLGPGYKVVASMGHIYELRGLEDINLNNNFECNYHLIESKKKNTENIKKLAKDCDGVILACDNDREGMAINYGICKLLNLDVNKTKRIVFNEITESALREAINKPTTLDLDIVYAQQARQVLDLLVGFKISPILWKYISKQSESSLSAGRCQTPALKIIYDNQKEIDQAEERKVYNTTGYFTNQMIPFELSKQFESEEDIVDFLNLTSEFKHIYNCSKPTKSYKSQPEPFTTSRLQQVASNELHYSPKETMKICQKLYESGYITYMRTDSKKYSKEFVNATKEYIIKSYNELYVNESIEKLVCETECREKKELNEENKVEKEETKKKTKKDKSDKTNKPDKKDKKEKSNKKENLAQEAHEAIRPTKLSLKELPEEMENKEKRLYKLIWENTLESCMSKAVYFSVTAKITSPEPGGAQYSYTSELNDLPGWKIVKNKLGNDNYYQYLQSIKSNDVIPYKKIVARVTIKNIKMHLTEARLVQLLEEKGIGRPSTFSALVDKIQERGYVKKEDIEGKEVVCKDYELENDDIFEVETKRTFGNEKGKLVIQPLGIIVIDFLEKYFNELFNYDYTREMENDLDKITNGEKEWKQLCNECNTQITRLVENIKEEKKMEWKIDENHFYIIGKHGPVIKQVETKDDGKEIVTFIPVKKEIDIHKLEKGLYTLEDIMEKNNSSNKKENGSEIIIGRYEDYDVILKKGKFGLYVTWGENSKTLKELGNRPIESIRFEEVEPLLSKGTGAVREITDNISIRTSKKGDYIFFKTPKMKKPSFFSLNDFEEDYKTCDLNVLKSWIKEKYNVY